jgi:thiamine-monophosphate kinase
VNLSDIAAMGGRPGYIQVSLGVPAKMSSSALEALYDGIFRISEEFGVRLLGGDTNKSNNLVIDVSVIGRVSKRNITYRSGARCGDIILITGPVRDGKKEHLSFIPRVREAGIITGRYKVNAMIDTSDGIAPDIIRVCDESGTGCVLYQDAIPLSRGLALEDALYYGESFELLFSMSPSETRRMFVDAGKTGKAPMAFIIGKMTPRLKGRVITGKEGKITRLRMDGYRHF